MTVILLDSKLITTSYSRSNSPDQPDRLPRHFGYGCFNLIIGLTGGIASGKSTVAGALGERGAYIIDADKLGHSAYVKGTAAFDQVVATFGSDVVGDDGEVDRRKLGGKVFGNAKALKQLTDIVWPAIRAMAESEIADALRAEPRRVVVLEAAVLIEAGWLDLADEIWVTVVEPPIAIERACARDNLAAAAVQARLDAQLSNAERRGHAHRVIDNSADQAHLLAQVDSLWAMLAQPPSH